MTAENSRLQKAGRSVLLSEEELPRSVKAYPALRTKPTGGNFGNMKQRVATLADQFGPVPIKEDS